MYRGIIPDHSDRARLIPYFVLIVSLTATLVASYYVWSTIYEKDRERYENSVQHAQDRIENRINIYMTLARASSGVFALEPDVTVVPNFSKYLQVMQPSVRFTGIQGVGYSRRIARDEVTSITEFMQLMGFDDFHIWPADPPRDEYHAILHLEPMDRRNRAAIGYDMFTDPTRRAAMMRARDTGAPAASGKVTLVQEIDPLKQPGFLIYMPVYAQDQPTTSVEQRREALRGFVYIPFRMYDFMAGIFGTETNPRVDFAIYEGDRLTEDALLYDTSIAYSGTRPGYKPRFTGTTAVNVAGYQWTLQFRTRPEFELGSSQRLAPLAPAFGLLISTILFGITRAQVRARMRAEQVSRELRTSERALRASEARTRRLIESSLIGVALARNDGVIFDANDAFLQIAGCNRTDMENNLLRWGTLLSIDPSLSDQESVFLTESGEPLETELCRADGTKVPVLITNTRLLGTTGESLVGFVVDLTGIKRAEHARLRSEQRLRVIADSLPVLISYIDAECRFRFNNRTYEDWFHLGGDEIAGRTMEEVLGPEAMPALRPHVETALAGRTATFETHIGYRTGGRDIAGTYVPEIHEGVVQGFAVLESDISDRKREEREQRFLSEASAVFSSSLDYATTLKHVAHLAVPDIADWCMVYLVNSEGDLVRVAYAHADPEKEMLVAQLPEKMPVTANFPDCHVVRTGEPFLASELSRESLTRLEIKPEHISLLRSLASLSYVCVPLYSRGRVLGSITLLTSDSGRHYGTDDQMLAEELARRSALAIDNSLLFQAAQDEIAERTRAQEDLRRQTQELEAAVAELEAFSYSVSHDLRAPLRAVDAYSKLLEEETGESATETAQRYLQMVRRNAHQMALLIDDLLAFSRLGRQPLARRYVDTTSLVRQAFDDLRTEMGNRDIEMRISDLEPSWADPRLLKQVYLNLLSNALKYTRTREKAVIEVGSLLQGDGRTWFVRDNGVGFRMKYADKLFGVFQRLHRAEEYEGTGVGLAIVHRIVTRHGGRIWAEGEEGVGACFYFTLGVKDEDA